MLHTNNEIDRACYFTILRTPWGEQMEDGLLCNSMGRIVDRTGMLEKLLKKLLKQYTTRILWRREQLNKECNEAIKQKFR